MTTPPNPSSATNHIRDLPALGLGSSARVAVTTSPLYVPREFGGCGCVQWGMDFELGNLKPTVSDRSLGSCAEPLKCGLQPFCNGFQMFFPVGCSRSDTELESRPASNGEKRNGNWIQPIPRDSATSVVIGIVRRHDIDFEFYRTKGNGVEDNDHPDLSIRAVRRFSTPENLVGRICLSIQDRPRP